MKKRLIIVVSIVALLTTFATSQDHTAQNSTGTIESGLLTKDALSIIDETVFELIIPKPVEDSLTYERPLPLDLLPYAYRKDDYYSVGTAFAITRDRFISAAHVLALELKSQNREMYIRDRDGGVYRIDTVYKYSDHKDFVVFSAKGKSVERILKLKESFSLNDRVFAVGNAHGEGIIVRDGILTSTTPEEEEGAWSWLRFSAAVSPGNSGGPLLDKNGEVIGVITRSSEKENLNYALPVSVIHDFKETEAVLHTRVTYSLAITEKTKSVLYDYQSPLPMDFRSLKEELEKSYDGFLGETLKQFMQENESVFFPKGRGSLPLLHTVYKSVYPNLIGEGEDGLWYVYYPSETESADLEDDGSVEYGDIGDLTLIHFRKPKNVILRDIYEKPKLHMELILKGMPLHREIMDESVRITSLGEASETYDLVDRWGRKWLVRIWLMEYCDSKIITFSLPVPEGTVTLMAWEPGEGGYGHLHDLKVLVDYIYLSYYGTFQQWGEFLQGREILPKIFSKLRFSFLENERASFESERLRILISEKLFEITEDSYMLLMPTFFKERGEIIWDIGGITMGEDAYNNNYFTLLKDLRPEEGLKKEYSSNWKKLCEQKHPFTKTPYYREGVTYVQAIHSRYDHLKSMDERQIKDVFIYDITLSLEGKIDDPEMLRKLQLVDSGIEILE
jgi:serine protease Do